MIEPNMSRLIGTSSQRMSLVASGSVELKYIPTRQQIADILTKALPRPNFEDLSNKLGLYDIHTPA